MNTYSRGIALVAVVGIVAVLALLGGGVYYASTQSAQVTTENESVEATASSSAEVSLRDLFGKNVMCTFSTVQENVSSEGTAYIAGNDLRVDAVSMQGDRLVVESHMIKTGEMAYVWSSMGAGAGQGAKINIGAELDASINEKMAVNLDEKLDYECVGWNTDQSKFNIPGDITFYDLSNVINVNSDVNAAAEINKCGTCDMIPDAAAKAQCKMAMGC